MFPEHWTLEEKGMAMVGLAVQIEEAFLNGDDKYISAIESCEPELRALAHWPIELALLAKQKVLTESVFNESYGRVITLYHNICNENNLEVKI